MFTSSKKCLVTALWRMKTPKCENGKKFHYCDLTLNWIETGRNFNQLHSLSNQKGRQDENFLLPRKLFIRSSQQVFFPASCLSFLVSAKKFCHCHVDFPFTMWWWEVAADAEPTVEGRERKSLLMSTLIVKEWARGNCFCSLKPVVVQTWSSSSHSYPRKQSWWCAQQLVSIAQLLSLFWRLGKQRNLK